MRARIFISLFLFIAGSNAHSNEEKCQKKDLTTKMCKGFGYCTGYPLGPEGGKCPEEFALSGSWTATNLDCLKGKTNKGKFSCANKGIIKTVILGKGNAYKCLCQ